MEVFPIEELRKGLEAARIADAGRKVFGAEKHQYRWNPPALPSEVEELEKTLGVSLPEEYRGFLLQAGNGGAGPAYGLFSVQEIPGWMDWPLEPEEPPVLSPERDAEDLPTDENWRRGCIPIGSQGDTYFTALMLTGPYRGRVVYWEWEGSWVFFPEERTFLDWYQRWLREVAAGYRIFWFGLNLDGGEEELAQRYEAAQTEEEQKKVLSSFGKFPVLSPASVALIRRALWSHLGMKDGRSWLELLYKASPELFHAFLEERWGRGLYDAVVREVEYATFHERLFPKTELIEQWWERMWEKLPQLYGHTSVQALRLLAESGQVTLQQALDRLGNIPDEEKGAFLQACRAFPDAGSHMELWVEALQERDNLPLLLETLHSLPITTDVRIRDALHQICEEFSKFQTDSPSSDGYWIYKNACHHRQELFYETINPAVAGIPRPYRLNLEYWIRQELDIDAPKPKDGIAIHPFVLLAVKEMFGRLPSTAYDWEKRLKQIKRLRLVLSDRTVRTWMERDHQVYLCLTEEFELPKPYYCDLEDWSILGRMPQLRTLAIECICVEDFSFLSQCSQVQRLSLYNTNFSDCRLLKTMKSLKYVVLRRCSLTHREALDELSIEYELDEPL